MQTKLVDMEAVREEIQDKLRLYLAEHGVDLTQNGNIKFRCIAPDHEDRTPSANIIPQSKGREWKCHGCGAHGDIFTAAHLLENKPKDGDGFLEETVIYLAEKYGIEVKLAELSESQLFHFRTRSAYRWALRWLQDEGVNDLFLEEAQKRLWDPALLREWGIGQIPNYHAFREGISKEFDPDFLREVGILGGNSEAMFTPDHMVFTLFDAAGRPIGFSSRDLKFEQRDSDRARKYRNTSTNEVFKKGNYLYNLHNAAKHAGRKVFVFEGHPDVTTYRMIINQENAVATCGTAFTSEHVVLLQEAGITDICIVNDGDSAGVEATMKAVNQLSGHAGLYVTVMELPTAEDENDPDGYIRKNGVEGWDMARQTASTMFAWSLRLSNINDMDKGSSERYLVLEDHLRIICNETVPFKRQQMLHELSREADTTYQDLNQQLEYMLNQDAAEFEQRRQDVLSNGIEALRKSPIDARLVLHKMNSQLDTLEAEYNADKFSVDHAVEWLESSRRQHKQIKHEAGLRTNWPMWDRAFDGGIPVSDSLIYIGGKPNTGKTSLTANLALRILSHTPDTIALIYTIDDSKERYKNRMLAALAGLPSVCIEKPFIVPEASMPVDMVRDDIIKAGDNANQKLVKLFREGRIHMFDSVDGSKTWSFADSALSRLRQQFPDKKIVVFVDNFHNLNDYGSSDFRYRYTELSADLKQSAAKYNAAIFATVHYTKLRDRVKPSNNNIAETVTLEYDGDAIVHLCNHRHEFKTMMNKCKVLWEDKTMRPGPMIKPYERPVVEMLFGKSKISGFKGSVYYKFDDIKCLFHEGDERERADWITLDRQQPWIFDSK